MSGLHHPIRGTIARLIRTALPGALFAWLLTLAPAFAVLPAPLPDGFFESRTVSSNAGMLLDADTLTVNRQGIVVASGGVRIYYGGYALAADRAEYDQNTGIVSVRGNVVLRTPEGQLYYADEAEVAGDFREAFLGSLVFVDDEGAYISAAQSERLPDGRLVFTDATYSPCGDCIDENGRRIGWRLKAARVERDAAEEFYYYVRPELELLGTTIPLLPSLKIPVDGFMAEGFQFPSISYQSQRGIGLSVPYRIIPNPGGDLLLTPTLYTGQGLMGAVEWSQTFENGAVSFDAWGIYQLDPGAYAGEPGDRPWRGAIQTSGRFTPTDEWTWGWSGTAFSDPAFFRDYGVGEKEGLFAVNRLYTTYLDPDTFGDIRVEHFMPLGDVGATEAMRQGMALPRGRFETIHRLDEGMGEFVLSGSLLRVTRDDDHVISPNGVDTVFGYEGDKTHLMLEGGWQNEIITDGGFVLRPYAGLRLDAATYDGASSLGSAPPAQFLTSATPIAALDVRWPLISSDAAVTQILEPVGQLVWRGGSSTAPGITNDDAHSFVFDDATLFGLNRFDGSDRQETGLRSAFGVHYNAQFANGAWLDVIAGRTWQLAGANPFAAPDPTQVTTESGLDTAASDYVFGAIGEPLPGLTLGAKTRHDTTAFSLRQAAIAATFDTGPVILSGGYNFVAATPATGVVDNSHEVSAGAKVPFDDYWAVQGGLHYDLVDMSLARYNAGIAYDDGYLGYGAGVTGYGPTSHTSPDSLRFEVFLKLHPFFESGNIGSFD